MSWRERTTLTPDEARDLHFEALVIDSKQPGAHTFGPTHTMQAAYADMVKKGAPRPQISQQLGELSARELWESQEARDAYLDLWDRSGVKVASATMTGLVSPDVAFEDTLKNIGHAYSVLHNLKGKIRLALSARDIEEAYRDQVHALVIDFQDTTPLGADLGRIDLFYNLGVRVIQLTYNLRNLVGDGCTERNAGGLSQFGVEVVRVLNERGIMVDVSHSSERVGWDALEVSSAPIAITHACARAVYEHDRAKSDDLIKAVADKGGYIGVVVIPAFIQGGSLATLDDFADQLEHIAQVAGIDAVGIGTDMAIEHDLPAGVSLSYDKFYDPGFPWHGFRPEHRNVVGRDTGLVGTREGDTMMRYKSFADWPNLTMTLAQRGFNEEELRKILGLNFLRLFKETVG